MSDFTKIVITGMVCSTIRYCFNSVFNKDKKVININVGEVIDVIKRKNESGAESVTKPEEPEEVKKETSGS